MKKSLPLFLIVIASLVGGLLLGSQGARVGLFEASHYPILEAKVAGNHDGTVLARGYLLDLGGGQLLVSIGVSEVNEYGKANIGNIFEFRTNSDFRPLKFPMDDGYEVVLEPMGKGWIVGGISVKWALSSQ